MRIIYTGHVQGVGFRYTVCSIAASFKVHGVVRNLQDGDVEVIAEGTEPELVGFLHEIRDSRLKRNIVRVRVSWTETNGRYDQFGIRYS